MSMLADKEKKRKPGHIKHNDSNKSYSTTVLKEHFTNGLNLSLQH